MQNRKGYVYKVTVFGSRNTLDQHTIVDSKAICRYLAQNKVTLVNGASQAGVMGFTSKEMKKQNGQTYGIGLYKVDPHANKYLDDWEAYNFHYERQKRLIELGDAYIVFTGGLATLYEAIDVHLMQFLGEIDNPLIFVGKFANKYKQLLQFLESNNQLHKLPSNIHFAESSEQAIEILDKHLKNLQKSNQSNKTYYPSLSAEEIYKHIKQNQNPYHILFNGVEMQVNPNVYPSNRFRSSKMLAQIVADRSKGKKVADIACGNGAMGLIAAHNQAKHVIQVDINPAAVENAKENIKAHNLEDKMEAYEGDIFEPLSYRFHNYFDVIYFNPPFHRDTKFKNDKLMYAFYTQGREGGVLEKFLKRAKYYLAPKGEIILGFSNKDPENLKYLEECLTKYNYNFELKWHENQNTYADNRVYKITLKEEIIKKKKKQKQPKIKLGIATSNTGQAANDGELITNGIKLALKELKQEEIKIEIGIIDDQSQPTHAIKGTLDLIQKFKPDALIGPTWSYVIDSVIPLLEDAKIPYFTPATSTELVNFEPDFMISGSSKSLYKKYCISHWIKQNFIKKSCYIGKKMKWQSIHANVLNDIKDTLQISHANLQYQNCSDFEKIIKKIKQEKYECIIIDNYKSDFYTFLKLIQNAKINIPIICNISIDKHLKKEIQILELKNPIYQIESSIPKAFQEKYYHEYPKSECSRYAFNAYAGTHLLVQSILNKGKSSIKEFLIQNINPCIFQETFEFDQHGDLSSSNWEIKKINI